MTRPKCSACQEDEHDCCSALFGGPRCPCRHIRYPEQRCGARGAPIWTGHNSEYLCDLPRYHPAWHEGRYWALPNATPRSNRIYGWDDELFRWWKRVIPATGRFDPYDLTAPSIIDQLEPPDPDEDEFGDPTALTIGEGWFA